MWKLLPVMVFLTALKLTGAFPRPDLDSGVNRTRRDIPCKDDLEYPHGKLCCSNCPAGTHMTSPCTRTGEKGKCEECADGTYTEHSNGLPQCFSCTPCRQDQETVTPCSRTQNSVCWCKSGRFCDPDQACEVCKKCSSCEDDEKMVSPCTPISNTVCKKTLPNSASKSGTIWVILIIFGIAVVIVLSVVIVCVWLWRRRRATDSLRHLPDGGKAGQYSDSGPSGERLNGEPQRLSVLSLTLAQRVRAKSSAGMEDERMLCESLNSSASNSQHSLTSPPASAFPVHTPLARPTVPRQHNWREDEPLLKLVPVNGEDSLKKSFEYFEDLDINYYKRFFRHLEINDNVIKSHEHHSHEDRIHELLNVWVEKEGRNASLNNLLKALLDLNQRRTAEAIVEKAIENGHYNRED